MIDCVIYILEKCVINSIQSIMQNMKYVSKPMTPEVKLMSLWYVVEVLQPGVRARTRVRFHLFVLDLFVQKSYSSQRNSGCLFLRAATVRRRTINRGQKPPAAIACA